MHPASPTTSPASDPTIRDTRPRRRLRSIAIWLIAVLLGFGAVILFTPHSTSFPPLPNPNGYDKLIGAAARISPLPGSLRDLAPGRLAEYVEANKPALDDLRRLLDLPSAVPVEMGEDWYIRHSPNMITQKQAAQALAAEATLRQRQGDYAGALEDCLDLLRFSQATSRGGIRPHILSGMACEGIAFQVLGLFGANLELAELRKALTQLQKHDAQRDPWPDVARRTSEWARKSYPISLRLMFWFQSIMPHSGPTADEKLEARYLKQMTDDRRFVLRLAARAFALERGRDPKTVEELVPGFLDKLPVDPVTGRALALPAEAK